MINSYRSFGNPVTPFIYPPQINVQDMEWGRYIPYNEIVPAQPQNISIGTVVDQSNVDVSGTRSTLATTTFLADPNETEFHGVYSKKHTFNADDTKMKFKTSNGLCIVPMSSVGQPNPETSYDYISVEGGGFWTATDPDLLFVVFNYTNTDVAFKEQTLTTPYGSETTLYDFTATHDKISYGNNEGRGSNDDRFIPLICKKKAGYTGSQYELIVLDIFDCRANPGGPNNIWSTMDVRDDNVVDWFSVSQTGMYIVEAVFNDTSPTTGNPANGNLIIVYENTQGSPTLTTNSTLNSAGNPIAGAIYMNQSHADLGIDIDGDDCYFGLKSGSCSSDNQPDVGGCMGGDNDTFMVLVKLSTGQTQYKYSSAVDANSFGKNGFYGGYVSTCNLLRPGWAYVTEDCCMEYGTPGQLGDSSGRASGDLFAIKLDYTNDNIMEYYGRSFVERQWGPLNYPTNSTSPQGCVSRNGTMITFDSWFSNAGLLADYPMNSSEQGPAWLLQYPQV